MAWLKINIDFQKLREKRDDVWLFVLDVCMVVLAFIYLGWTLLDLLLRTNIVAGLVHEHATESVASFYEAYTRFDTIFYDTIFVSIFLAELLVRWAWAIHKKTYHKWFFFPFVHWYDTLGCIPIAAFKFFRVIRVVSIVHRLHKLEVIDFTQTFIYKKGAKYLNVLVEEVSDRVVINVLQGVQTEIESGNPLADRIINEVVKPQKAELIEWLSVRVQNITSHIQHSYQADIQSYVDDLIEQAVAENKEISRIEMIPLVGNNISQMLERAISDIVFKVINQALSDLGSARNKEVIDEVVDISFNAIAEQEDDHHINALIKNITSQSLEVVKAHIEIQQWKLREKELKEIGLKDD